jgi:hypothetical protein
VFLSDWYADPAAVRQALGSIRARGHDVIAFHLLDPAERTFPFDEAATFEDLETGDRLPVVPAALADRYRALHAAHVEGLASGLGGSGVDYFPVSTADPLDRALHEYLTRRQALARVR